MTAHKIKKKKIKLPTDPLKAFQLWNSNINFYKNCAVNSLKKAIYYTVEGGNNAIQLQFVLIFKK